MPRLAAVPHARPQGKRAPAAPRRAGRRKQRGGAGGDGGAGSGGVEPKEEPPYTCGVCMDDNKDNYTILQCCHTFCTDCMQHWSAQCVADGVAPDCPNCRAPLSPHHIAHGVATFDKLNILRNAQIDKDKAAIVWIDVADPRLNCVIASGHLHLTKPDPHQIFASTHPGWFAYKWDELSKTTQGRRYQNATRTAIVALLRIRDVRKEECFRAGRDGGRELDSMLNNFRAHPWVLMIVITNGRDNYLHVLCDNKYYYATALQPNPDEHLNRIVSEAIGVHTVRPLGSTRTRSLPPPRPPTGDHDTQGRWVAPRGPAPSAPSGGTRTTGPAAHLRATERRHSA
jgi:Ring finger domain